MQADYPRNIVLKKFWWTTGACAAFRQGGGGGQGENLAKNPPSAPPSVHAPGLYTFRLFKLINLSNN